MSQCKSCGAELMWATTPAGKSMPLEAKGETLWLVEGGVNTVVKCKPVVVRRAHWAQCPGAGQHRTPKDAA